MYIVCGRNSKEASVAGAEGGKESDKEGRDDGTGGVGGSRIRP